MDVQFYDVKARAKVSISSDKLKKKAYERTTKDGKKQVRYALRANNNGTNLTKFVSKDDYDKMDVPVEK